MDSESETSSATSRNDLLEDHFSSLEDLHAPEIDAAQNKNEQQIENHFVPQIPQSGDVQNITSNALFESEVSPSQDLLNSARSEASWRATQDVLTQRVQILEARLLEEAARADAAEAAQIAAEQSLAAGFNNFNQQLNTLLIKERQFYEKETDFVAHLEVQAHTEEALLALEEQLQTALEENSRLRLELDEDRRESLELRGRVESTAELKNSLKALTRGKIALENQVNSLQSALNEQREAAESLAEQFAASKAVALQLEAVIREKDAVLDRAQQTEKEAASLLDQLNNLKEEANANENVVRQAAKEQATTLQELAQKRGAALRQIIEFLDGSGLAEKSSDAAGQHEEGNEASPASAETSRAPIDPAKAVELVFNVCQSIVDAEEEWEEERNELEEALQQAVDGSEDLIRRLRSEEARSRELETQYNEMVQTLQPVQDLVQSAAELEARAQSAEVALETCREELADAAAKAAAAALEASQLKTAAEVAREKEREAVSAAKKAQEEAEELRNGAEAREQRADEMRAAAAAAMDLAGSLKQGIQYVCASTAAQLHQTAALLTSGEALSSFSNGRYHPQVESVVDNIHSCIAKLQSIDRLTNEESSSAGEVGVKAVEALQDALGEVAAGFGRLVPWIEEHRRMHSALSRAVQEGGDGKQNLAENGDTGVDTQSPTSQVPETLEELLGQLLDRFDGFIESVQTEKLAVEAQFNDLQVEYEDLSRQAESLESVLRSAVHAGPGSDTVGEALIQLAAGKRRVAELEAVCAQLQESAELAQQEAVEAKASAARDWSGVRADVAQLVQHAERAQIDAESALQQQRAETAKQLSVARAKEHAALAARSKAEAEAAKLREDLVKQSKELESFASNAAIWQAKAAANYQNLQAAERRLVLLQTELEAIQTAAAEDGQRHVLRESEFVLRQRVSMLEGLVGELQQHAAAAATQLVEAQSRVEAAEAETARQVAAAEAACARAETLEGKIGALQSQVTALELNLLEQQTSGNSGTPAAVNPPSLLASTALIQKQPDQRAIIPYANAEEELRLLLSVPVTNDVPALKRRLEAALRQIENLKALNNNLQQQLSVATSSLKSRRTSAQATAETTSAVEGGSMAMAHAMIDALQEQMLILGLTPVNSQQNKEGNEEAGGVPLQRVISLWKQACAARDERIEESERRLSVAGRELEAKEAELVAMRHAVESLKQAREGASAAAVKLEKQLREAEEQQRAAEIQVKKNSWAAEERDALNARLKGLEGQCKELESRVVVAEARAVEAEHALAGERAKAKLLLDRLDSAENAEIKVQAAERRAAEAEEALSKHLEGTASQFEGSSLGLQLERAWETERKLALRIEEVQVEAAGAKSQLETALEDVERYEKRSIALQEQLDEAIAALAEQGTAIEALQDALNEQTVRARR